MKIKLLVLFSVLVVRGVAADMFLTVGNSSPFFLRFTLAQDGGTFPVYAVLSPGELRKILVKEEWKNTPTEFNPDIMEAHFSEVVFFDMNQVEHTPPNGTPPVIFAPGRIDFWWYSANVGEEFQVTLSENPEVGLGDDVTQGEVFVYGFLAGLVWELGGLMLRTLWLMIRQTTGV